MIELSNDGQTWRKVAARKLSSTWNPQTIRFAQTETASSLRLTAQNGCGAYADAAPAELAVLYAWLVISESADGGVIYCRIPSTSSNVDEGSAG